MSCINHWIPAFAGMTQVVERRQKQAAEVVPIPLLWRSARHDGGGGHADHLVPIPLLWRGARQGGVGRAASRASLNSGIQGAAAIHGDDLAGNIAGVAD